MQKRFFAVCLALLMSQGIVESVYAQSGSLAGLFGQAQKGKFLPVNQAFGVTATQENDALVVNFAVTPEHYVYKDKISVTLPEGVTGTAWQFNQPPSVIDDPEFGKVSVFEQDVRATMTLTSGKDVSVPVVIKWQGCAKAGLCYPPETLKTTITLKASAKTPPKPSTDIDNTKNTTLPNQIIPQSTHPAIVNVEQTEVKSDDKPSLIEMAPQTSQTPIEPNVAETSVNTNDTPLPTVLTEQNSFATTEPTLPPKANEMAKDSSVMTPTPPQSTDNHRVQGGQADPFGINERPVLAVFLLFMAGLLLSFTPCVYPMIPIVANIVARQKNTSPVKGFMLSAGYGVGVATAYGILGAIIASLGQAVGIIGWLQNPYILAIFAVIFVVLALAMFDVINVRLPAKLGNVLQQKSQMADGLLGSVGGSFVVGVLSALVVSPCVSFPMAGALTAISTSKSVVMGFVALFALGLGLSLPLMVIGAIQGKFMPKAGQWMVHIKSFCGFLLLAVAVGLLGRITSSPAVLLAWAVWFALVAVWLYRLGKLPFQALALLGGGWAICLLMGFASGSIDPSRPLANVGTSASVVHHQDIKVTSLNQLDQILASHDKVLVDVTADWCVECRIMERTLFADRPAKLADYQVVKLDITDTTDDSKAVLQRYQLFGPPALLIYHNNQLTNVLLGEVKRADFEKAL